MDIHRLIESAAFEPEATALMGQAYQAAKLRLGDNQSGTVLETVARRIIDAAHRGERDVETLTALALRGLDGHGSASG